MEDLKWIEKCINILTDIKTVNQQSDKKWQKLKNVLFGHEKGEQIPEYGGFILDISDKLKDNKGQQNAACDENTKWSFGKWQEWVYDANLQWYWEKKKNQD